jgi:DNA-binding transcriptional LysR family regulator
MDLRQLEVFVAVAETLSFSKGADRLDIAQPAASQSIQTLERSLGVPLLLRTNRRVSLTPAGEALLPRAKAMVMESLLVREEVRRTARGEIGRLRIGTMGAATHTFLPELIRTFRSDRPGVMVEVAEMTPTQQYAELESGRIDVAFTRTPSAAEHPDLRAQLVYTDQICVCMPESDPLLATPGVIPLTKLAERDWVFYERAEAPQFVDSMHDACRKAGFTPRIVARARLMATIPLMVACGVGVSLVPGSVRHLGQPGAVIRAIAGAFHPIPLVAVVKDPAPRLVREFLAHLGERSPGIAEQMEFV